MITPSIIYGTAWKENETSNLVKMAISAGFNAIDTANQPKHYQEHLVGEALKSIFDEGIKRESLFIQTKFTPVRGQGQRIPYDKRADLAAQVNQSFTSSLNNLHTDYIDSYLLHCPYSNHGIGESDLEVWGAIEDIYRSGHAKVIGISNINLEQLESLTAKAEIKPMVVQNRCYADQGWDKKVREFCNRNDIVYQGFSLLTANTSVVNDSTVKGIAKCLGVTKELVIFRFALKIGILPLTGTTSEKRMKEDLKIVDFDLTKDEILAIRKIAD